MGHSTLQIMLIEGKVCRQGGRRKELGWGCKGASKSGVTSCSKVNDSKPDVIRIQNRQAT